MGDKTGISWTDATWNCIRGCRRVSAGCEHCYAETMAARFCDEGQPYYQLAKRTKSGPRWTGKIKFINEHLADPLRWTKPRRIFVNSMSDLFFEDLTNEEIAAIFGVMAACPQHIFQVLTKRSKRLREWFEWRAAWQPDELAEYLDETACNALAGYYDCCHLGLTAPGVFQWPLPNVWIGVSVEDQAAADKRIPDLLAVPAAVRFLSCEPLIGQVNLAEWLFDTTGNFRTHGGRRQYEMVPKANHGLHWVIGGCESGPGARPADHRWFRLLRDQCAATGVKYFLKQARAAQEGGHALYPSKHAARSEVVDVVKLGNGSKMKAGGVIELPYLDGVQHKEFPNGQEAAAA